MYSKNKGNYSKVNCQADIKRKQAMFNRFKRRFHASKNPTEKRFLKTEAVKVSTELKQWSKRWQTWGFGACTWITKSFTASAFTSSKPSTVRKSAARKSPTSKTYGYGTTSRSSCSRTSARRPKSRTSSRAGSSAARKSYVAW